MPNPIKSSRASTKWQCAHTLHSLRWYNSTLMTTLQYTHRFDFVFLEENIRQRNTDQIRSNTTPRFYILILKWANITATNIIYIKLLCVSERFEFERLEKGLWWDIFIYPFHSSSTILKDQGGISYTQLITTNVIVMYSLSEFAVYSLLALKTNDSNVFAFSCSIGNCQLDSLQPPNMRLVTHHNLHEYNFSVIHEYLWRSEK